MTNAKGDYQTIAELRAERDRMRKALNRIQEVLIPAGSTGTKDS